MIRRFGRVRELYSTDGAPQQMFELFGQGTPLPVLPPSFAVALYGIMIFALICGVFGFRTRLAFLIGAPLYTYFNLLDAVSTMTKYSVIAAHVLLILAVSECHLVWSIDAVLKRWKDGREVSAIPPRVPVWPARLIQILFCFVYFGAAITKIQTQAFFSGEQMRYWMLSNWNYANPDRGIYGDIDTAAADQRLHHRRVGNLVSVSRMETSRALLRTRCRCAVSLHDLGVRWVCGFFL